MGFYGTTRTLFLIGSYLDPTELTDVYLFYWRVATIVGMIGLTTLLFVLEKNPLNQRTKYIGTIAAVVVLVVSISLGTEAGGIALAFSIPFLAIIILAIYLYLTVVGQGEMRTRSLESFLGVLAFFLGVMFDTNIARDIIASFAPVEIALIIQGIFAPILLMSGVIILIYSYRPL